MFGLSFSHLILLSALALIFIGPKQLPEVARQIGKFLNEMKRVGSDFSKTIIEARESTNEALKHEPNHEPNHESGKEPKQESSHQNTIMNPEPISYADPTVHGAAAIEKASDQPTEAISAVAKQDDKLDANKAKHD
jgi:sec-independent protein translocase protein TatB